MEGLAPSPLAALAGSQLAGFHGAVPCAMVHPGQGCMQHSASFFPEAYLRALPVYVPGAPRGPAPRLAAACLHASCLHVARYSLPRAWIARMACLLSRWVLLFIQHC